MSTTASTRPPPYAIRDAILDVLRGVLPTTGVVLEASRAALASTSSPPFREELTGPYVPAVRSESGGLVWSISAWGEGDTCDQVPSAGHPGDASEAPRPMTSADAIVCINMAHIASWSADWRIGEWRSRGSARRIHRSTCTGPVTSGAGFIQLASNEEPSIGAFAIVTRTGAPRTWEAVAKLGSLRRVLGAGHHRYARRTI